MVTETPARTSSLPPHTIFPSLQPFVSVIIPCYGQAHFLGEAIESVLAQTYEPFELIVISDGSPDNVAEVSERYAAVRLYGTPDNRGISQARNLGLGKCRGDYLVFLDADDRLLPNALASGVRALSDHPRCALVWGQRRLIDAEGNPLPAEPMVYTGGAGYEELLRENVVGPPVGVMFRRKPLEEAGGFTSDVGGAEDYGVYLRLARSYETFCHGELIAEYRIHGANMSLHHEQMAQAGLAVLEQQEPWVSGNPRLSRALAAGRRKIREQYDAEARLARLRQHVRARRWGSAVSTGVALLFKYPRVFFPLLLDRVLRTFRRGP
jgi:cellulose synthase/poly-beta-1,6-N-acetylglucosamine synthase-like glycosyltransferase